MLLYVYVPLSRSRHKLTELAQREALSPPFYTERETEAQGRRHLQCRSAAQLVIRRGVAKPPLRLIPLTCGVLSLAFPSNI